MKVAIPWILVFALLVGCFFLYSTTKEDQKEIIRLRADSEQLPKLQADLQNLQQLKVEHDELVQLRNEHEELLRLRGEAGVLRKQSKQLAAQLQAAQAQSSQALQTQQQTSQLANENEVLRTQAQQLQQEKAKVHATTCIANLRIIDSAKELWANVGKHPLGSSPTSADLAGFCPNNTFPVCPDAGAYNINRIGTLPTCSVAGHALPTQ